MNYRFSYADTQSESPRHARSQERELLRQSIQMMIDAQRANAPANASVEAVHFASRIWTAFLNDLSSHENALPAKLRADLISIGIWILGELDSIRLGGRSDFQDVIEITETIREGLL